MADVIVEIFGDNDPFKKGRDSAKQFLKVMDSLVKKSQMLGSTLKKEVSGIEFKGLKDVQKLNQQISALNKTLKATNQLRESQVNLNKKIRDSQKQSNKVTADGVKLQKQAVDTTKQEIAVEQKKGIAERESIKNARERQKLAADQSRTRQVQLRESQALIREKERLRKAEEKEKRNVLQSTNAYKKLTRVTNAAQFQFKSLAAEFGVNSKQAQNAFRRFSKLDGALRKINDTARDGRRDVGRYSLATKNLATGFRALATGLVGGLGVVEGLRQLVNVFREGLQVSRDFGLATGKLQAISGASANAFNSLTEQARELGATTQFTASQVAELQLELSKLGFDATQIEDATGAVLDFAVATDSDLARSGEVIAATLNAFQLEASEAGNVADIAAKAFSSSALDIEKFSTAISNVGPAANAVEVSLERTTAILGKIVDSGIDASTAGTQLRNVFIELEARGLTWEQAITQINSSQSRLTAANELFGKKGSVVATVIANNSEAIDDLDLSLQNAEGSAANAASVIGDTLDGDIKRLTSAFEGLLLEGGALDVLFRELTRGLTLLAEIATRGNKRFLKFIGVFKDFKKVSTEQVIINKEQADSAEALTDRYEDLVEQESLSVDEKNELEDIQTDLINLYGESATQINKETGELILNVSAIRAKIAAQRALESEEASSLLEEEARLRSRVRTAENAEKVINSIIKRTTGEFDKLTGFSTRIAGLNESIVNELSLAAQEGSAQFVIAFEKVKRELSTTSSGFDILNDADFKRLTEELGFVANAVGDVSVNRKRIEQIKIDLERLGVVFPDLEKKATGFGNGAEKAIDDITGAINRQRAILKKLQKEKDEADEADIASFDERIRKADKELKRLEELGVRAVEFKKEEERIESETLKNRLRLNEQFNRELEELKVKQLGTNSVEDFNRVEEEITALRKKNAQENLEIDIDLNDAKIKNIQNYSDVVKNSEEEILKLENETKEKLNEIEDKDRDEELSKRKKFLDSKAKLEQDALEKELEDKLDAIEQFEENVSKLLDLVDQGLANQTQKRLDGLTRSLEDNRKIQNELREDAKNGSLEAQESLALEQKKEAELEQQRLKLEKQQRQRELAFAFLKILNANLSAYQAKVLEDPNTPNTALIDSVAQFGLASGFTSAIAGNFIEGTEDIGKSLGTAPLGNVIDNYVGETGGKLFRFDGREAILSPEQNKKRGGLSNDKTVEIAHQYLKGDLVEKSKVFDTAISMTNALMALSSAKQTDTTGSLIKGLRGDMRVLTKEIKKLPDAMPVSHSGFNNKTGMVEEIVKRQGRVNTVLERLNKS